MSLTSNKVGNVTVQAILKAKYNTTATAAVAQTKYYTGTQIFAVGNGSVGDVVVMSVGSNEIVINDAKATIDAAPIVKLSLIHIYNPTNHWLSGSGPRLRFGLHSKSGCAGQCKSGDFHILRLRWS